LGGGGGGGGVFVVGGGEGELECLVGLVYGVWRFALNPPTY